MTRKLSVTFGITSRSWGGNEKWASEAARGLAERGHRILVLWSYRPVLEELKVRGLRERHLRLWGDVNPVGFSALLRVLREERPDVLVLTKQREYWMGGLAARLAGRPLVALRLGLNRPIVDDFKRRAAFGRLSDLVIVNSEVVRAALLATPWLDPAKVAVLYNGVTTEPVDPAVGSRALEEIGVPDGSPVITAAGRLTWQKGFDVLIRAFPRVVEEFPAASLVILGEGGRRQDLENEATRSGVGRAIRFAGHRTDVREVLSEADVYVLSSRNEGMANTLLEAMSVGAPIVATDVSGTSEAVRDGREALIVPPENPGELARAITEVLRDRDLASRLGSAAAVRARERFGTSRMIDDLEGLLTSALAQRRR
jgi:glycosyltransferase involved in cell wall biosynthesis